jgi:hypothetical protein
LLAFDGAPIGSDRILFLLVTERGFLVIIVPDYLQIKQPGDNYGEYKNKTPYQM